MSTNSCKYTLQSSIVMQLPKDWKTAVLIPLLKKNKVKSDHPALYPLPLTSCIGTLVERMINDRLNWWLEHINIITPRQAGFRSIYTTEDQLINIITPCQAGLRSNYTTEYQLITRTGNINWIPNEQRHDRCLC